MSELLYLALGDSTAAGIGARSGGGYPDRLALRLREAHPGLRLINLGTSGATTSDVLAEQLPRALRLRPRLITLAVGINDVGLQLPDEAFALNLEELAVGLARLHASTAICTLPDLALAPAVSRYFTPAFYERRIQLYNKHVEATAARHGLKLIDLWRISRDLLPGHPEYFCPDGFHPSAAGYDAWAERMEPEVRQLLEDRTSLPA